MPQSIFRSTDKVTHSKQTRKSIAYQAGLCTSRINRSLRRKAHQNRNNTGSEKFGITDPNSQKDLQAGFPTLTISAQPSRQKSVTYCADGSLRSLRRQDRAKASLLSNCIFIQSAPVSVHILFSDSLKYSTALCQSQSKKPLPKVFLYFYTIFVCNLPQYML